MLISTNTVPLKKWGDNKKIIKLIKDVGFDAYDFTMYGVGKIECIIDQDDYKEKALELRKYADSIGIVCNQTHSYFPMAKDDYETRFKYVVRSIEVSGILGAKYVIIHPVNKYSAEENAVVYEKYLPYAKENNVIICLENLWLWDREKGEAKPCACSDPENYLKHLELIDKDWFQACLDLGHAEMNGLNTNNVEMIKALGSRLKCLHIHDNDKVYDLHKLPFTGNIDFEAILDALKSINYSGDITFESDNFIKSLPVELYPDGLKMMLAIGKYFKKRLENN